MLTVKDSKNRESTTLAFVTIAFLLVCGSFVTIMFTGTPKDIIEAIQPFGIAIGVVLGPWLGREWIKKDDS